MPFQINGASFIKIGEKVHVHTNSWLLALKNSSTKPDININDGVYIGRFAHIVSTNNINIEKNVLISDKVYISDNVHNYKNIQKPIKEQEILNINKVNIGKNSWLGENVCVIGASVGKHCVVGANSVVLSDIPDYSIAVGTPAKVIKKYCPNENIWKKI
jgi:acetyltransferase-like isoleucine patch superfamily enzyme